MLTVSSGVATSVAVSADILRVMPSKAIELTAFDAYKKLLSHEGEDGKLKRPGPLLTALAGAAAGNTSTSSLCCRACIEVLGFSGCLHPHLNSSDTVGWRVLGQLRMPWEPEGPYRVSAGAASSFFGAENAVAARAPLAFPTPTPSPGISHFQMSEMLPPSPPTLPPPHPSPGPTRYQCYNLRFVCTSSTGCNAATSLCTHLSQWVGLGVGGRWWWQDSKEVLAVQACIKHRFYVGRAEGCHNGFQHATPSPLFPVLHISKYITITIYEIQFKTYNVYHIMCNIQFITYNS